MPSIRPLRSASPASLRREQEPLLTFVAASCLFFLVGSFVFSRIVRTSFLLQSPQGVANLPWLYLGNAIWMLLLSSLYVQVEQRFRRDRLNLVCLACFGGCYVWMWYELPLANAPILAACYWLVEIIGNFSVLQAWSLFQSIVDSRQAKRLFPYITAGGALATVVFGFASPWLTHIFGTNQLIAMATVCLLVPAAGTYWLGQQGAHLLQASMVTSSKAGLPAWRQSSARSQQPKPWRQMLGLPILPWLIVIVGLMHATSTLLDFRFQYFLAHTWHQPDGRSAFLGWYYGITGLLTFVTQLLLTPLLLRQADILLPLLALPLCLFAQLCPLLLLGVSALGWPMALHKGSEQVLRFGVQDNVLQLLLLPLPAQLRGQVKTVLDGFCKPLAIGLTGLLLASLPLLWPQLGTEQLLRSSLVLAGLCALLWCGCNWPLRQHYRQALMDGIGKRRLPAESSTLYLQDAATSQQLRQKLLHGSVQDQLHVLALLPFCSAATRTSLLPQLLPLLQTQAPELRQQLLQTLANYWPQQPTPTLPLNTLLQDPVPMVRIAAMQALAIWQPATIAAMLQPMLSDADIGVQSAAICLLHKHQCLPDNQLVEQFLTKLIQHHQPAMRQQAALLLGQLADPAAAAMLLQLLQDPNPVIIRTAIAVAGQLRLPQLLPKLLTYLQQDHLRSSASDAILRYQAASLPALQQLLLAPMPPSAAQQRSMTAAALLLATLGQASHIHWLVQQAWHGLETCRSAYVSGLVAYQQRQANWRCPAPALRTMLQQELAQLTQWQACLQHCPSHMILLREALVLRKQEGLRQLLRLLSLRYVEQEIMALEPIVLAEANAQRANALEWLSHLLQQEDRAQLLPWLEWSDAQPPSVFRCPATPWGAYLAWLLQHEDPWLRAVTCYELGRGPMQPELAPAVLTLLQDPNPLCRESALPILLAWQLPQRSAWLEQAQTDPADNVRLLAMYLQQQHKQPLSSKQPAS